MKNLIKLICIIVLALSVNSCGVSWQIQSVNQAAQVDTLYDVDVITTTLLIISILSSIC